MSRRMGGEEEVYDGYVKVAWGKLRTSNALRYEGYPDTAHGGSNGSETGIEWKLGLLGI